MPEMGIYHSDHEVSRYTLAAGWMPVEPALLDAALGRVLSAFDADAVVRVSAYYDPSSEYAGGLLTQVPEADPGVIDAADLFAVTTLSVRVHPRVARALTVENSATRQALVRTLDPRVVPTTVPITALDQASGQPGAMLTALESVYLELRSARVEGGNAWVFASKMCARKRPYLFPVRDRVVCELLNGAALRRGGIGSMRVDLQVFAYVMSSREVTNRLRELRGAVGRAGRGAVEDSDLRLLDVVLWTKGIGHWG